jgi:hypothetical protein
VASEAERDRARRERAAQLSQSSDRRSPAKAQTGGGLRAREKANDATAKARDLTAPARDERNKARERVSRARDIADRRPPRANSPEERQRQSAREEARGRAGKDR